LNTIQKRISNFKESNKPNLNKDIIQKNKIIKVVRKQPILQLSAQDEMK